jgi:hypothetical protein
MKQTYLILFALLIGCNFLHAQYCTSTATSLYDTETWNVTLNGQTMNINQSSGALGVGMSGQYSNYTGTQVADVVPTLSYTVTTLTGDDGSGPTYYSRRTSVYIDWNQDYDFTDAGELLGTSPYAGGAPITYNFNFTVPMSAVTGTTRMRVVTIETSAVPPSCSTYTYGETEDYSIEVLPLPTCMPVTGVGVSAITATSVQVNWSLIDGLQTAWIIEYGLDGFTPGSGTQVPVASYPYVLTGLDPETAYDVYVYADCGGGDISYAAPAAGVSFTTPPLCPVPLAPVTTLISDDAATLDWNPGGTETMWDVEWDAAGFLLGTGNQDFGLTASNDPITGLSALTDYHWYVRAVCDLNTSDGVDTVSYFVGPSFFTTTANCANPTALNVTNNTGFESDLGWTAGSTETEWNIQWGTSGFPLNGTGANLITNVTTIPYGLSGLTPGTAYQFYVQAICGSTPDSMSLWVGPFTWTTATFCATPSTLNTSVISTTSATVIWTENGTATEWTVEYGPSGFTPGTGTQVVSSSASLALTGLTPDTDYCFYVQANCGSTADSSSAWAGPSCFTTISSCPQPSNLGAMNITYSAANLFWQEGGTETTWDIEWGAPGFTPGMGEEAGSVIGTTSNPHYVTGLNPSAPYHYYVRAACGGADGNSLWSGPFAFKTVLINNQPCDAIDIVVDDPMIQHYNNTATVDAGEPTVPIVAGQCLSQVSWCTAASNATVWFSFTAPATGAATITTFGDMTNFRTQIALFSTGDCGIYANYDFEGANTLDPGSTQPPYGSTLTICDLEPGEKYFIKVDAGTTTGPGNFGIGVNSVDPNVSAGTSLGAEICENSGSFDLFMTITGNSTTNGIWYNPTVAPGNELPNVLDFTGIPAGTYPFFYVDGTVCGSDTVETAVVVAPAPDAGEDNSISSCNTERITLMVQLNGTPEFGGTWSDDDNSGQLDNGEFDTWGLPAGTYDFTYTVESSNSCPDDEATVSVTLTDCLGLEEEEGSILEVYPNPVADVLTIRNLSIEGNAIIEVIDVSGKVVVAIDVSGVYGNYELDLGSLSRGVYTLRVWSEEGLGEARIIRQ